MARVFNKVTEEQVRLELEGRIPNAATLKDLGGYLGRNQIFEIVENERILKIFHHESALRQMRELESYRLLRRNGLSAPFVLDSGELSDGTRWIQLKKVPGFQLEPVIENCADEAVQEVFGQLGHLIAKQHSIAISPTSPLHYKTAQTRFDEARQKVLTYRVDQDQLLRDAAELALKLQKVLPNRQEALVHRDASSRNVLAENEDGRLRLTALIDYELALIGDPMEDIAKIALKEFWRGDAARNGFLDAYYSLRTFSEHDSSKFTLNLIYVIFDIAKWAIEDDQSFFRHTMSVLKALLEEDPTYKLERSS